MKRFIGHVIAIIGAHLWEKGGYTGDGRYEDLKLTGRIGFNMFTKGLGMAGVTMDDIEKYGELITKREA